MTADTASDTDWFFLYAYCCGSTVMSTELLVLAHIKNSKHFITIEARATGQ